MLAPIVAATSVHARFAQQLMEEIKMICNIIQPVPSANFAPLTHQRIRLGLQVATSVISTIEDGSRYAISDTNTNHLLLDLARAVNG
jgi:hypothetical protein